MDEIENRPAGWRHSSVCVRKVQSEPATRECHDFGENLVLNGQPQCLRGGRYGSLPSVDRRTRLMLAKEPGILPHSEGNHSVVAALICDYSSEMPNFRSADNQSTDFTKEFQPVPTIPNRAALVDRKPQVTGNSDTENGRRIQSSTLRNGCPLWLRARRSVTQRWWAILRCHYRTKWA